MKLLCLNNLRGLWKKKIQTYGTIIMIMLSTTIYVGINSAIDTLENSYDNYLEKQNVEDISVYVDIDYSKDVTIEKFELLRLNELSKVTSEESVVLDKYESYLMHNHSDYDIALNSYVQNIFDKYGASNVVKIQILDSLASEYDFVYELEKSKTLTEDGILVKALPYSDEGLNQTYLVSGRKPIVDTEITVLPEFAKCHGLEIGDSIEVSGNLYKIVGYTYAPDYIYPLLSLSMPIFDEEKNNIIYMTEDAFDNFIGLDDNVYSIKYNYKVPRKAEMSLDEEITDDIFSDEHIIADLNTVSRITRIGSLQLEFDSYRLFAKYFLYLLLIISIFIVIIVIKKNIEDNRFQIGILKSLGYGCLSITMGYLVYPILSSIIGGIIGFIMGIFLQGLFSDLLLNSYCIPLNNFSANLDYLINSLLLSSCILSVVSCLVAIVMLQKKPLVLLNDCSDLKVNLFSRFCNKLISIFPFELRIKFLMTFRSLGKIFIVTFISFGSGLLIVFSLIGSNLFSGVINKSFMGIDYNYIVTLNGVESEEFGNTSISDYVLSASMPLSKVTDKNGNEKKIEKLPEFNFTGIDSDIKFIKILNEEEKNINHKLSDGVIVNENARKLLNLEIGDILTFSSDNKLYRYSIVDFSNEYVDYNIYIDRELFSHDLGFTSSIYNSIYSTDSRYGDLSKLTDDEISKIINVLSVDDLKENMSRQMQSLNFMIYVVILFASIIVFVIVFVIASIVVDENKRTVSIMKIIGYDDKTVSNVILNVYTPFIIIGYFISIPVIKSILQLIMRLLISDIKMTIPIEISWVQVSLGLIALLIAYKFAILLSKRTLNKIPLSIALKRE